MSQYPLGAQNSDCPIVYLHLWNVCYYYYYYYCYHCCYDCYYYYYYYFPPTSSMPFYWSLLIPFYLSSRLSSVCMFLGLFSFPYFVWEISLSQILMCTTQILPLPLQTVCGDQSLQTSTSFSQVQLTAPHCGSLISPSCFLSWVTYQKPAIQTRRQIQISEAILGQWFESQWINTAFSLSALR